MEAQGSSRYFAFHSIGASTLHTFVSLPFSSLVDETEEECANLLHQQDYVFCIAEVSWDVIRLCSRLAHGIVTWGGLPGWRFHVLCVSGISGIY